MGARFGTATTGRGSAASLFFVVLPIFLCCALSMLKNAGEVGIIATEQ